MTQKKTAKDISNAVYRIMVEGAGEAGDKDIFGSPKMHVGTATGNKSEVKAASAKRLEETAADLKGHVLVEKAADGKVNVVERGTKYRLKDSDSSDPALLKTTVDPEAILEPDALEAFKSGTYKKNWVKAKESDGEYLAPTGEDVLRHGQGGPVTLERIAKRSGLWDSANNWLEQPERSTLMRIFGGAYGDTDPNKQSNIAMRLFKTAAPTAATGAAFNYAPLWYKNKEDVDPQTGKPMMVGQTSIDRLRNAPLLKDQIEDVKTEQLRESGKLAVVNSNPSGDWNSASVNDRPARNLRDYKVDQPTFIQAMLKVYQRAGGYEKLMGMKPDVILDELESEYSTEAYRKTELAKAKKETVKLGDLKAYVAAVRKGEAAFYFPPQIMSEQQPDGNWKTGRKSPDGDDKRYIPIIVSSGSEDATDIKSKLASPERSSLVWIDTSKRGIEGYTTDNMALSKVNREAGKKK
jgi:hypothetical protein